MLPTSFFASAQVHAREVTLGDGSVHVLYFKELPAAAFRTHSRMQTSADTDQQDTGMFWLIAQGLSEADGQPALTFEQACQLKLEPAKAIFQTLLEVNGLAGKKEDRSPGASVSGTN